jgi:hypothetical protein
MVTLKTIRALVRAGGLALTVAGCPQASGPSPPTPTEQVWVADTLNSRVLLIQYSAPLIPVDPYMCPCLGVQCECIPGSPGCPTTAPYCVPPSGGTCPTPGQTTNCPPNTNNGQPVGTAVGVIGQPNYISSTPNWDPQTPPGQLTPVNAYGFSGVSGIALDSAGNLWVADTINSRVLMFQKSYISVPNFAGPPAQQVIGQPDFNTTNGGPNVQGNNTFSSPQAIAFDSSGNLYVGDNQNCRIMVFQKKVLDAGQPNQPAASIVLGQPDFNSACTGQFGLVNGIAFDGSGDLWAATSFNGGNTVSGVFQFAFSAQTAQAQGGIGFKSGDTGQLIPTGQYLFQPFGLAVTGSPSSSITLWVSDGESPVVSEPLQAYNRVIEFTLTQQDGSWNVTPVAVLGQGQSAQPNPCCNVNMPQCCPPNSCNMTCVEQSEGNEGNQSPTPGTLSNPTFIALDSAGNLFVADSTNNRVNEYVPAYATQPCQQGQSCSSGGSIYTGDNATFIIGEPNGYTTCNNALGPSLICGPNPGCSCPNAPPPSNTTLNQPMGIIPVNLGAL